MPALPQFTMDQVFPPPQNNVGGVSMDYKTSTTTSNSNMGEDDSASAIGGVGVHDVLSGRSQQAHNHPGNREFRKLVATAVASYTAASSNMQKSIIVNSIISQVVAKGGRFLKQDSRTGAFIELDEQEAKAKTAHAIRDKSANFEARNRRLSGASPAVKAAAGLMTTGSVEKKRRG